MVCSRNGFPFPPGLAFALAMEIWRIFKNLFDKIRKGLDKVRENRYNEMVRRGVAQFGSALGLGPRGRRFESCRPDHHRKPVNTPFTGFFHALKKTFDPLNYPLQILITHFYHTPAPAPCGQKKNGLMHPAPFFHVQTCQKTRL